MVSDEYKIIIVSLRYSYGKKELGGSLNQGAVVEPFRQLGFDVSTFWIDDYNDVKLREEALVLQIKKIKPKFVFFKLYRNDFTREFLLELTRENFTIGWFGDDQWRFDTFTKFYANTFRFCVTTDKFSIQKYREIGQDNVILSQHASFFDNSKCDDLNYKYDVTFVGGYSDYRAWFVSQLALHGVEVHCFGNGWPSGRLSYKELDGIVRSSKINLNISNSVSTELGFLIKFPINILRLIRSLKSGGLKVGTQTKARIFEVPMRGGFLLTEYVPTLEDYFKIGSEIACYTNPLDCSRVCKFYLKNELKREVIRRSGVEVARKNHSYFNRIKQLVEELELSHVSH